jgi:hypothetical protein
VFDSPDGWTGTLTRFVDLANTKLLNGTEAVMATSEETLSTMQMACEEREDFADPGVPADRALANVEVLIVPERFSTSTHQLAPTTG